jgi:hypothetical protein
MHFPGCVLTYGPLGMELDYGPVELGSTSIAPHGARFLGPGDETELTIRPAIARGLDHHLGVSCKGSQFAMLQAAAVGFGDGTGWEYGTRVVASGAAPADHAQDVAAAPPMACERPAGEADAVRIPIRWTKR